VHAIASGLLSWPPVWLWVDGQQDESQKVIWASYASETFNHRTTNERFLLIDHDDATLWLTADDQ
jgi:hypothetical protein